MIFPTLAYRRIRYGIWVNEDRGIYQSYRSHFQSILSSSFFWVQVCWKYLHRFISSSVSMTVLVSSHFWPSYLLLRHQPPSCDRSRLEPSHWLAVRFQFVWKECGIMITIHLDKPCWFQVGSRWSRREEFTTFQYVYFPIQTCIISYSLEY